MKTLKRKSFLKAGSLVLSLAVMSLYIQINTLAAPELISNNIEVNETMEQHKMFHSEIVFIKSSWEKAEKLYDYLRRF
jgi:hypothetical protein